MKKFLKQGKEIKNSRGWQFAVFKKVIMEGLTEVMFEQRPEEDEGGNRVFI